MAFTSRTRLVNPRLGTYFGIFAAAFAAIVLMAMMFEQLGAADALVRLVIFAVPAYVLSHRPGFVLEQVWYFSVAAVTLQFAVNMALLKREFKRRLNFTAPASGEGVPTPA